MALLLFLLPLSLLAQPANQAYTLQDCIDLALRGNVDLRNTQLSTRQARETLFYTRFTRLPSVFLNGSQGYNYGRSIDPFTNQFVNQNIRSNNFSLSSNLTLFSGFQISNTIKRAKVVERYNISLTEQQVNTISLTVAQNFLAVISAQEQARNAQTTVAGTQSDLRRVEAQTAAGTATRQALLELRAKLAQDQYQATLTESQAAQARLTLAQSMALAEPNFKIVYPEIPEQFAPPVDTVLERLYPLAEASLPEIRAARQNMEALTLAQRVAAGAYQPTLTANFNSYTGYSSARTRVVTTTGGSSTEPNFLYFRDTASGRAIPINTNLFSNSNASAAVIEKYPFIDQVRDNISQSLTFQLSIPIFNNFRTRSNVAVSNISRLRGEVELERARQTLRNQIGQALFSYTNARARLAAATLQAEALGQSVTNIKTLVQAGRGSSFEQFNQEQSLLRAQNERISARYDLLFRIKVLNFYAGQKITSL